jgi:hypothetical protein
MTVAYYGRSVRVARVDWTSNAAGDATQVVHIDGQILRVVTDPDAVAAPTALYDITFVDEDGFDILAGDLANRSATVTEQKVPTAVTHHYGSVTVTIAAAGDTKSGVVKIYVR